MANLDLTIDISMQLQRIKAENILLRQPLSKILSISKKLMCEKEVMMARRDAKSRVARGTAA